MCGCGTDSRRGKGWCPRYQFLAVMRTLTSYKFFFFCPCHTVQVTYALGVGSEEQQQGRQVIWVVAELKKRSIRATHTHFRQRYHILAIRPQRCLVRDRRMANCSSPSYLLPPPTWESVQRIEELTSISSASPPRQAGYAHIGSISFDYHYSLPSQKLSPFYL